jgi:hypothetical protein
MYLGPLGDGFFFGASRGSWWIWWRAGGVTRLLLASQETSTRSGGASMGNWVTVTLQTTWFRIKSSSWSTRRSKLYVWVPTLLFLLNHSMRFFSFAHILDTFWVFVGWGMLSDIRRMAPHFCIGHWWAPLWLGLEQGQSLVTLPSMNNKSFSFGKIKCTWFFADVVFCLSFCVTSLAK